MAKKKQNKTLLIILVVLVVIYAGSQLLHLGTPERNFRSNFFKADTAQVTRITLKHKGQPSVDVAKNDNGWVIKHEDEEVQGDPVAIQHFLGELLALQPESLAGTTQDDWKTYEVGDSAVNHIKVYNGDEEVGDVYIGKFSYSQATRKATAYARAGGDENTYAVEGMSTMGLNANVDQLRDKRLVDVQKDLIQHVAFQYPADSSFEIVQHDQHWSIGADMTHSLDSAKVASFLSSIHHVLGRKFVEANAIAGKQAAITVTLGIKGEQDVTVDCYPQEGGKYIVHSSAFPKRYAVANTDSPLWKTLVKPKDYFLKP